MKIIDRLIKDKYLQHLRIESILTGYKYIQFYTKHWIIYKYSIKKYQKLLEIETEEIFVELEKFLINKE